MAAERDREIERICQAVLERPRTQRETFLAEACGADDDLRREVERLLAYEDAASAFLETPALAVAAQGMGSGSQALSAGQKLGAYTILSPLGSGGMGEVYRARDVTLGRDVAIKVLPTIFTADPERLARFEREARVLASLNHPNIATIHGVEHGDGLHALILEVVEGQTLEARIGPKGRPLPLPEALAIARQIAEALEAAHEKGIVHRDLKPANIKVRPDGLVKVLDFGLAKAITGDGTSPDLPHSPTVTVGRTGEGVLLGTAAYMSPEQARGKPVDKRADIWAFGCVLYEMLAGHVAFQGETVTDTLAAIVERDPSWSALPHSTPAAVQRLLVRCLDKDPKRRLHDIADARIEIEDALRGSDTHADAVDGDTRRQSRLLWSTAAVVALVVLGGLTWYVRMARTGPPRISRMTIASSGTTAVFPNGHVTTTPDGTRVVYAGKSGTQLFVRPFDQLDATVIVTGAAPMNCAFVSPDGQWVGFQEGNTLKKVALTGGPATTILNTGNSVSTGATWGPDDTIIFGNGDPTTGLQRVSANGGEATVLTRPVAARGELDHLWPKMLPGGRAVLFTITATTGGPEAAQVAVLDLVTGTPKVLVRGGSRARYVPSGHLVYAASGALRAVPFDLARLEVRGAPVTVLPPQPSRQEVSNFDVSADGTLAYSDAPDAASSAARTLVWVDRQGREEPLALPPRAYAFPRLSPDGERVAVHIADPDTRGENDIWVWDIARQTLTPLTIEPGLDFAPVWTKDGRRLLFFSPGRNEGLFWQAADGTGTAERLGTGLPSGVTPDGRQVLFSPGGRDVMTLTLDATRHVQPLIQTPFNERNGVVSPDGRWLAYESDRSGRFEIYVQPFPNVSAGQWQISTGGGTRPLWAPGGQELFYLALEGAIMTARVEAHGATWSADSAAKVVDPPYITVSGISSRTYDVSTDGQRFLMVKQSISQAAVPQIIVVQNWLEELKRLVPTR